MTRYLYLSLIPESLVASMLPPRQFGTYLAVGTRKCTRGQAMFLDIPDWNAAELPPEQIEKVERECVPHADGSPKHSFYFSIYRVLEKMPLRALRNLFLVTPDGRVLELERSPSIPEFNQTYHLYQEICPVHPRIVSTLNPLEFIRYITDPGSRTYVPKICFADLRLGELARDPTHARVQDLPYYAIEHLRDCLMQLRDKPEKGTKMVDRSHPQSFPYRVVENGIFIGAAGDVLYYPFPSAGELQSRYYEWWQSASIMSDILWS